LYYKNEGQAGEIEMTEQTTFKTRVEQLRAEGMRPMDANRIALAEERARAEEIANQTYRR
jgi:hypothetical protein